MTLWVIALFGLLVRVAVLWRLPEIHYDEAVNGLMARHILRGEFPAFFWGQDHAGTLAAFLIAVPFAVLGSSVVTLRLVPLAFSLLLIPLSYRLARALYDQETARLAMLYAAVPPLVLLHLGATAKDPYAEMPILGLLLLLLAVRLVDAKSMDAARAFVLGLVAGLAWWTQVLLVSYLLVVGLVLLVRRRWVWLAREGGAATLGFLVGSFPFWLYNLLLRGESLGLVRGASVPESLENFAAVLRRYLPVLLGGSTPWPNLAVNRMVLLGLAVIYVPACGFLLYEAIRSLWRRRFLAPAGLLIATAAAVVAVDVTSTYAQLGGAKYLFPLYGVLPVLLAHYTVAVKRAVGLGAGVLLVLMTLGLHTQETLRDLLNSFEPGYLERQTRPPMGGLIGFLRSEGIFRAYGHFTTSLRLTFDTREEILASDWYGFRNPRYLEEVQRADRVALITHQRFRFPDPSVLGENLRALGGSFRKRTVDGFVVFYDFRPPPLSRPIPSIDWSGHGRPRGEGSHQAYDRDAATWWGSGEPQRPGLAYELDLGRPHRVTAISLHPGPIQRGAPRGYRVDVSLDGSTWTEVVRVGTTLRGLHWSGSHPRLDRSGRLRAAFPPVGARYVRVTQTGRARHFWWSVGEIFVYEHGPLAEDRSLARAALEEGQRLEARAQWEFLGASPIARSAWRTRRAVDWGRVLEAYGRAIREDPELEEAHHRLAVVRSRLGIPEVAGR